MDKINRTLLSLEDIKLRQDVVERKTFAFTVDGEKTSNGALFGVLDGKNVALIVVFDGEQATLDFNGAVTSGASPLVAVVSGKGELCLTGTVKNARALVIGAKKIY